MLPQHWTCASTREQGDHSQDLHGQGSLTPTRCLSNGQPTLGPRLDEDTYSVGMVSGRAVCPCVCAVCHVCSTAPEVLAEKHPVVASILQSKARVYSGTYKVRLCPSLHAAGRGVLPLQVLS